METKIATAGATRNRHNGGIKILRGKVGGVSEKVVHFFIQYLLKHTRIEAEAIKMATNRHDNSVRKCTGMDSLCNQRLGDGIR